MSPSDSSMFICMYYVCRFHGVMGSLNDSQQPRFRAGYYGDAEMAWKFKS